MIRPDKIVDLLLKNQNDFICIIPYNAEIPGVLVRILELSGLVPSATFDLLQPGVFQYDEPVSSRARTGMRMMLPFLRKRKPCFDAIESCRKIKLPKRGLILPDALFQAQIEGSAGIHSGQIQLFGQPVQLRNIFRYGFVKDLQLRYQLISQQFMYFMALLGRGAGASFE